MTVLPPICLTCKHFDMNNFKGFTCKAFPGGIPEDIIQSKVDHHQPYTGDGGIQYEPMEKENTSEES